MYLGSVYIHHWHEHSNSTWLSPTSLIPVLALFFTIGSFWYIYRRRGKLRVYSPHSFALYFAPRDGLAIRVPLVFEATGAKTFVVQNLRLSFIDYPEIEPLLWSSTKDRVQPESGEKNDVPAVFAIAGNTAIREFVEFQGKFPAFDQHRRDYSVRIEGYIGNKNEWIEILTFTLYTTNITDFNRYLAYKNLKF